MITNPKDKRWNIYRNSKYSIMTSDGFKPFKGVLKGIAKGSTRFKGINMSLGHLIKLNDKWIKARDLGETITEHEIEVYDILDVSDVNSYSSGGFEHHNCQTGEQLVHILDTKLNEYKEVSFESLQQMIMLDNIGIDYNTAKIIDI